MPRERRDHRSGGHGRIVGCQHLDDLEPLWFGQSPLPQDAPLQIDGMWEVSDATHGEAAQPSHSDLPLVLERRRPERVTQRRKGLRPPGEQPKGGGERGKGQGLRGFIERQSGTPLRMGGSSRPVPGIRSRLAARYSAWTTTWILGIPR